MIVGIPRDDQLSKDRAAVRLAPLSRRVAAASPDCGFTHEGRGDRGAVAGVCIADFPERSGRGPEDVDPNALGTQIARGIADLWRKEICPGLVLYSGPDGPLSLTMQLQFCRLLRPSSPRCY